MAATIKQTEARPSTLPIAETRMGYPESRLIWERIEAYVAHRWTPREVVWIVEGEGEWQPPLTPCTFEGDAVEVWESGAWVPCFPELSPLGGYDFPGDGPYRISGEVGGGILPEAVREAYERLCKYCSAIQRTPGDRLGYRQMSLNKYDAPPIRQTPMQDVQRVQEIDGSVEYITNWPARAMQLSGAADLLRPYRRA